MSSNYCVKGDIEAIFGPTNVGTWADLDNDADPVKIAARIALAIDYASNEIDDRLRNSRYVIPLTTSEPAIPDTVKRMGATYAGVWLYEARGVDDVDNDSGSPRHRLSIHVDRFDAWIKMVLSGQTHLDAVLRVETTVPKVNTLEINDSDV